MEKRRRLILGAVSEQAAKAIADGNRFQVRREVIGDDDSLRRMLNELAVACRANIRASQFDGLVTFYSEDEEDGTGVVVATVKQ